LRRGDYFYIDKTAFIEHFLDDSVNIAVSLICRPRRFGKSLNMDTLRCFLTDREDSRELFAGLAVERSRAWQKLNSAPVFYFDFKGLTAGAYERQIYDAVCAYLFDYAELVASPAGKRAISNFLDGRGVIVDGLRLLTEAAYEATGKKAYILIDEYDKLLIDKAESDAYAEIREFLTYLFSAGFKGNGCLEKALLTGVMRISYEGLFSGLNNVSVFDVFGDFRYSRDFGVTEDEMRELAAARGLDIGDMREWYDGFCVGGEKLYNIFSVSRYLISRKLAPHWGKSGTMGLVARAADADRMGALAAIVAGGRARVPVGQLSSPAQLEASDAAFYSLLVQAGYLALACAAETDGKNADCANADGKNAGAGERQGGIGERESAGGGEAGAEAAEVGQATAGVEGVVDVDGVAGAEVCVPNKEMRIIWKEFIFNAAIPRGGMLALSLFGSKTTEAFRGGLERLMTDALSFWDFGGEPERVYHVFVLGGLAFSAPGLDPSKLKSNREAGDGRYDIWMERSGRNYIFEFKACDSERELDERAEAALRQIDDRRYGAELDRTKPFWKVGVSFCGKQCRVKCEAEGS
jgi:hypothetical protein